MAGSSFTFRLDLREDTNVANQRSMGSGRKRWGIALLHLIGVAVLCGMGHAQAPPELQYGVESWVRSRYVFRGLTYSEGPVSQTATWFARGNVNAYVWFNVLLEDETYSKRLSEIDFGVSYQIESGSWAVQPAYDRYTYRVRGAIEVPPTGELSLAVTRALAPLELFAKQVVDVGAVAGAYYGEAAAVWAPELGGGFALGTTCTLGWASSRYHAYYYGVPRSGLSHAGVRLEVSYAGFRRVELGLQFERTSVAGQPLRSAVDRPDVSRLSVRLGFQS